MKKLLLLSLFVCAFCSAVTAQTYYYKLTEKVDPQTGVRTSYYGQIYVTFTQEGRYCYESDKGGRSLSNGSPREMTVTAGPQMTLEYNTSLTCSCDYTFKYIGEKNNMYQYRCEYKMIKSPVVHFPYGYNRPVTSNTYYNYVNFSTDFKRINIQKDSGGTIIVGERATPPGQASAPTQMW